MLKNNIANIYVHHKSDYPSAQNSELVLRFQLDALMYYQLASKSGV